MKRLCYIYFAFCALLIIISFFGPTIISDIIFFSSLYAIASIGWAINMYAGQLSFGHAAFFGIGAYTAAILYIRYGITPWMSFLIAPLLASLLAIIITLPAARYGIRGPFYSLLTLALAEVMRTTFLAWDYVGRSLGLWYPLTHDSLIDFQFHSSHVPYVLITLIVMSIALFISIKIQQSKIGYAFFTTKDNEDTAQAIGVNTLKSKVIASVLSAILTSLSGIIYAQFTLFISPENAIGIYINVDILLPAVIGGIFSPYGPIMGSFILNPLIWLFRIFFGAEVLHIIFRGLLLALIVYISPEGIMGLVKKYQKYLR